MRSIVSGMVVSNMAQDNTFVFIDTSIYNTLISIQEPILKIIVPYATAPVLVSYIPSSNTIISTLNLGSQKIDVLPCGLYDIVQSICPATQLNYHFYWVNLNSAKRQVQLLICKNQYADAIMLDKKIKTIEALAYCGKKDKVLALLQDIDCAFPTPC